MTLGVKNETVVICEIVIFQTNWGYLKFSKLFKFRK